MLCHTSVILAVLDRNAFVFSEYENYAHAHYLCYTVTGYELYSVYTFKRQLKAYLFHI